MLNDCSSILSLLHTRRSGKARNMVAPGPNSAQLMQILQAAMRVPDHGKLAPWRFVIVPQERRGALADEIERAYRNEKPGAGATEIAAMRAFALEAPVLVVVLSTPHPKSHIPLWEQQLSAGAAIQTMMLAAHALGFVANWLTGWPAYAAEVRGALGGSNSDSIAGFVFMGTPSKALEERPRPDPEEIIRTY